MIRRDSSGPGETVNRWILIAQADHARLAGKLAEHWGAGGFLPLEPRDALLWAVFHHDDGWPVWDAEPDVEPRSGRPRSFTEMEEHDSLEIWSGSIALAEISGPLEAYLVAGHFCALARRSAAWKNGGTHSTKVTGFLEKYESLRHAWLGAWQREELAGRTRQIADTALAQLQFFDALSLWFCCSAAVESATIEAPGGLDLVLLPQDAGCVRLTPWPLDVPSLNLEIPGRAVPSGRYADREDLAAAPSQPVQLRWELRGDSAAKC